MPRKRPVAPGEIGTTKLQDDRWRARKVIHGKAVFREARTQKDAIAKIKEYERLIGDDETPSKDKASCTVTKFINDIGLKRIEPANPKSSPTYLAYAFHAKRFADPEEGLGWKEIRKVEAGDLLVLYGKYADRPASARYLHRTIHKAMKDGVQWGYLSRNVAATVRAPKYQAGEVCPPEPEELARVLAANETYTGPRAVKKPTLSAFLILMLHSGCRPSELIGLTWSDVNWGRNSITISKTRDGKTGDEKTVKRKKSKREVSLSGLAMDTLRAHRLTQPRPFDLVFANDRYGTALKVGNIRVDFKALCEKLGLSEEYTLYDIRHCHATQMLAAGMPLHELSWRLGHASVSITADVYAHKVRRSDAVWAEKLASVLVQAPPLGEVQPAELAVSY
jgi:integrase